MARRGLAKGCSPRSVLDQTFMTEISILKSVLPYLYSPKVVEMRVGKLQKVIMLDLISLSGHSYVLFWISYHFNLIK